MKKAVLTTLIVLTLSQIGLAQTNFDKTKLDNYFNALEQNDKFMGSVAVSKNGEIIYKKSIGFADVENNIKATEKSKYRIGSISKTFTTVLILKAVEEKTDISFPSSFQFETGESEKQFIIPPKRVRYLSEIVENSSEKSFFKRDLTFS